MDDQRRSFQAYVRRNSYEGYSSSADIQLYICPQDLYDYWNPTKIAGLCNTVPADDTHQNYLRIFSILVWIGAEQSIHNFTDRRSSVNDNMLPMSEDAYEAHRLDLSAHHRDEFLAHQWRFAPLVFGRVRRKQELDRRHMIPIQSRNPVSTIGDYESEVLKVKLHAKCGKHCCNNLGKDDVIFKQMEDHDMWQREVNAYIAINNPKPADFVTGFYGSFFQGNSGTIVLEYATGGTLETFLQSKLPLGGTYQQEFWEKMFDLTLALNCIHHNKFTNSWGIHQDIKPDNILVFKDTTSLSPIPNCFKIADLGRSYFGSVTEVDKERGGIYTGANMMYSAPEFCHLNSSLSLRPAKATPEMDIWALGAVFSEALVWSIRGEDGRDAYTQRRKESVGTNMTDAGYDGCFHDGETRLGVVDHEHHDVLEEANKDGGVLIGRQVSDVVLGKMLQPLGRRGDARDIYTHWSTRDAPESTAHTRAIARSSDYRDSESCKDTLRSRPAPSRSPPPIPVEPLSNMAGAQETIETLWAQLKDRKHRSPRLLGTSAQFAPGYSWMEDRIKGHREPAKYYIFIDDCWDMEQHRGRVAKTLRVMGKLLKQPLKMGSLSVRSSASESNLATSTKSKDLERAVSRLQFTSDEDWLEMRWGGIIQDGPTRGYQHHQDPKSRSSWRWCT